MYLYAFRKALAQQGYDYSYEEIRPLLGQKTKKVISDLIPESDEGREEKIRKAKEYIDKLCSSKECIDRVVLLPHAKEVIQKLHEQDYILTILTNSDRSFVKTMLRKFSLNNFWHKIITADDDFETKEDAILFLSKTFKVAMHNVIYIGDMVKDIEIARRVGCRIISIPGWHSEETLKRAKPDYLIHDLIELPQLLNKIFKK
jgi:phosphoglycolate phosphatase-like HAD superfamily hydrolase